MTDTPPVRCSVHGRTFIGEDDRCHWGTSGFGDCPHPLAVETGELTDLVTRAEQLVRDAAWGDGGERPRIWLEYTERDGWSAAFSSFYDGAGDGQAADFGGALAQMLDDQANAGARAAAAEKRSAVAALSRHLHVSHTAAETLIDEMERAAQVGRF